MKILIDMDGTLNDFTSQFARFLKEHYSYELDYFELEKNYRIEKAIKADLSNKQKQRIVNEIFEMDSFWLTFNFMDSNVYSIVKYLYDTYDVYIATAPWRDNAKYKSTKTEWIKKNLSFIDTKKIYFESEKWKLEGDIIIDDRVKVLQQCQDHGIITIMPIQPYNKTFHSDYKFKNWSEVKKIVDSIHEFISKEEL